MFNLFSKITDFIESTGNSISDILHRFGKSKILYYIKWCLKTFAAYVLWMHLVFILFMFILIMIINFINPPFSSLMLYRNIFYNQKNLKLVYVPLKWTTLKSQNMFIMTEDYKFDSHMGFDIEAIQRAYNINKRYNLKLFGGSTITQQIARTLFLIPKKTYLRKYLEVIIAFEMEILMTKKRILELYLNYVELGNGVFGIGKASLYYYGKSFYKLDYNEIAKLVAILPSPRRFNPDNFYLNQQLLSRYNFLISKGS